LNEHAVYATAGAGRAENKRVVVRIYDGEDADKSSTLLELPQGLTMEMDKAADRPPAWQELTRCGEVALAENDRFRRSSRFLRLVDRFRSESCPHRHHR
jgi:hypothetical protein